ncbi:hypothetical protein [Streptomyces sp. NPDC018000]
MVIDDNAADVRTQPRDAAPHLPVGLRPTGKTVAALSNGHGGRFGGG